MGTATYYLRATWPTKVPTKTKKAILDLLQDLGKAYTYWQENRNKKPEEFWPTFEINYPHATKFLESMPYKGDCNNGLSGKLDYGQDHKEIQMRLTFSGNVMMYYMEVWHFMDWQPLCNYLENELGASKTDYLSDEHTNPFEILEAKENTAIVEDLLKNKKALPTLMGLSKDLDARIAGIMKGK